MRQQLALSTVSSLELRQQVEKCSLAALDDAQAYAVGFMGALGDHESVATAHKQACAAISLEGLGGGDPPQMKVRPGVDASKLVLAAMR